MKKRLPVLLLLIACLCLTGCSQLADRTMARISDKAAERGADALARQFVDGLLTADAEASLAAMIPGASMESLLQVFPQMQELLPDSANYTLTPCSWNSSTSSGVTQDVFQFIMTFEEETFLIETVQRSDMEGLYNISIYPSTSGGDTAAASIQTPAAFSILLTLLNIGTTLLIGWALVDCIRHRISRKWVWILLILLANLLLTVRLYDGRASFLCNIGLYLFCSELTLYSSGFLLRLMLPIGPVIYLLQRKALIIPSDSRGFQEAFREEQREDTAADPRETPAE